jgi:hypothetical protein
VSVVRVGQQSRRDGSRSGCSFALIRMSYSIAKEWNCKASLPSCHRQQRQPLSVGRLANGPGSCLLVFVAARAHIDCRAMQVARQLSEGLASEGITSTCRCETTRRLAFVQAGGAEHWRPSEEDACLVEAALDVADSVLLVCLGFRCFEFVPRLTIEAAHA